MSDVEQSGADEPQGTRQSQLYRALAPPIRSICSALGGYEDEEQEDGTLQKAYKVGDECLSCLRDLKRFWRYDDDDDDRTVARIFAETNVLANDLLPILQTTLGTSSRGNKIALACADLIGAMTWPIDVVEELREADMADEKREGQVDYSGLLGAHLAYKAAILRTNSLSALFRLMLPSLERDRRTRTERDENVLSLILHIIRNLASIKDRPTTSQSSSDALELSTLQSELIVQLQSEHFFDLLITIGSQAEGSEWAPWNMVVLDILHLLFRGVNPVDVAGATSQVKAVNDQLNDLLSAEKRVQKAEKRKGASRHSRFGTTLTLTSGNRRYHLHQQAAVSLSPSKVIDMAKRTKAKKAKMADDLAPPSRYRSDALVALRTLASSFVESSLNSFFISVLKDIRLEREKVKETDNVRVLVLAAFFLEYFLLLQKADRAAGVEPQHEKGHDFDLVGALTDTTSISYAMARMNLAIDEKPPLWKELHAGIECFVQMLLVIEAMSASTDTETQEIGMTLQNKLYYDAKQLEIVFQVITGYKDQSKRYLDSVIHLTYTLMRMLEKYSKNTEAMYVRRKRKKKRQQKRKGDDENGIEHENPDEDDNEPGMTYAEHAFRFDQYEKRLASEGVLTTLMTYLSGYKSFTSDEQPKRLVALMHRQAVKSKAEGLFFKVSVLELFRRIIDDEKVLPRTQPYQDLIKLVDYIVKRFMRASTERPMFFLEAFFPHRRGEVSKMMRGENPSDGESDGDEPSLKLPAELEFKTTVELTDTQRMGIAVGVLSDEHKEYLLDWVKDALRITAAQRDEIVLSTDGGPEAEMAVDGEEDEDAIRKRAMPKPPSEEAVAKFEPYEVPYPDGDMVRAGTRDVQLKLLLRLLQWESHEGPARLIWTIPASRLPADLAAEIRIIDGFLINPLDTETGKSAAELLRKKRKPRTRRDKPDDVEGDPDALSDADGDGGGGKKMSKRRQKRVEERKSFKSAQFIDDSDEEDLDEFYAKEAALKARNEQTAGLAPEASQAPAKGKGKANGTKTKQKRKRALDNNESDAESELETSAMLAAAKAKGSRVQPRPSKVSKKAASTSPSTPSDASGHRASTPPSSPSAMATSPPAAAKRKAPSPAMQADLSSSPPASSRRSKLSATQSRRSMTDDDDEGEAMPPSSGRYAGADVPDDSPVPIKKVRAVIADSDDDE